MLQTTGAFKAAARLASATPPPAYVLSRGIGWQVSGIILISKRIIDPYYKKTFMGVH
jgi:hypothetical protein